MSFDVRHAVGGGEARTARATLNVPVAGQNAEGAERCEREGFDLGDDGIGRTPARG